MSHDPSPQELGRVSAVARRLARRLPGLRTVARTLDATRAERDRMREDRDRLRTERDRAVEELEQLRAEHGDATQPPVPRASFVALLAKSQRQHRHARDDLGWGDAIWEHNAKLDGYRLADELGVARPRVYWTGLDLSRLNVDTLPDRFVVKPSAGTGARGVYPLVREGDGFRSLFEEGSIGLHDVIAGIGALAEEGRIGRDLVVEELIERRDDPHALPYDWKVYCFGGRAELVLQKDPCGTRSNEVARFRFFDRDWRDLGPVRYPHLVDPTLPPPRGPDELLATAERVSAHLARPFVRVDLFEGASTVRFGEITPHPGGDQWYGPEIDERLGTAWERAEVRLGVVERPSA